MKPTDNTSNPPDPVPADSWRRGPCAERLHARRSVNSPHGLSPITGPISRRELLVAAGATLAGCATSGASLVGDEGRETTVSGRAVEGLPLAASALPVEYGFERLREEVQSGGPPKDGIPSIDEPAFWDAEEADAELDDRDVVFGLVRNGEVKAYPQKVV